MTKPISPTENESPAHSGAERCEQHRVPNKASVAAIVPAAGRSVRMGRPKLVLTIGGQTVLARVVKALRAGGAGRVVVVAPPADSDEGPAIAAEGRLAG